MRKQFENTMKVLSIPFALNYPGNPCSVWFGSTFFVVQKFHHFGVIADNFEWGSRLRPRQIIFVEQVQLRQVSFH